MHYDVSYSKTLFNINYHIHNEQGKKSKAGSKIL